jgi:hypothetical protein
MKNYLKNFIGTESRRGFAILFTVLLSAIVLSIAIGISEVAYQEAVLSASAREGNIAFFAADTGADCALYWDRSDKQAFDPTDPDGIGSFSCAGNTFGVGTTSFSLNLNNSSNCAAVTVTKNAGLTQIESLGYNVPCAQANSNPPPPRIVQRAIRVTY